MVKFATSLLLLGSLLTGSMAFLPSLPATKTARHMVVAKAHVSNVGVPTTMAKPKAKAMHAEPLTVSTFRPGMALELLRGPQIPVGPGGRGGCTALCAAVVALPGVSPCNTALAYVGVDVVVTVLKAAGISIPNPNAMVRTLANYFSGQSSSGPSVYKDFVTRLKNASGASATAQVMYDFAKRLYNDGILWDTIKAGFSDMKWYEWAAFSARLTATLAGAFVTGGAALVVSIIAQIPNAVTLGKDIDNAIDTC